MKLTPNRLTFAIDVSSLAPDELERMRARFEKWLTKTEGLPYRVTESAEQPHRDCAYCREGRAHLYCTPVAAEPMAGDW